jgi:hypothetical protein
MSTELKQSTSGTEEITLSGKHDGPDVPVRIHYETGYREDEYGDDVRSRRLHAVRARGMVGRVFIGDQKFEVGASKEIPVELFETYEAEIDKAMSDV